MKKLFLFTFLFFISFIDYAITIENTQKKKIVFVKDDDGEFFHTVSILIEQIFSQKGWTNENAEYIDLSLEGKESKKPEIVKTIKKIKPDVVLINSPHIKDLALALNDENIPFVSGGGLELQDQKNNYLLIDQNGFPTKNITGTFTMPLNHLKNSFQLLNKIAPLNGKKVAFASYPTPAFTKEKVENALNANNLELKEFKTFLYVEDYQKFVEKCNNDPEIGWIISGEYMGKSKNKNTYSLEEFHEWERNATTKPNVGFWETSVQNGNLCGLAIDSLTTVYQMINIANKILNGEKVQSIKPQNPSKVFFVLNQMRAQEIGVKFDLNTLGNADKIFTDYNGNFISRE